LLLNLKKEKPPCQKNTLMTKESQKEKNSRKSVLSVMEKDVFLFLEVNENLNVLPAKVQAGSKVLKLG